MAFDFNLITKKSMIVCGGEYVERQKFVDGVKTSFNRSFSGKVFSLSEHIKTYKRYLSSMKTEFPIPPDFSYPSTDDWVQWMVKFKHVLVVIPELQKLHKEDPEHFYSVLGDYLTQQHAIQSTTVVRLLVTLSDATPIDLNRIPVFIGTPWKPSEKDVAVIQLG